MKKDNVTVTMDLKKHPVEDTTKNSSKRRRLGYSLGNRNTSWVPPFATPPSSRNSGGQRLEPTGEMNRKSPAASKTSSVSVSCSEAGIQPTCASRPSSVLSKDNQTPK